MAEPDRVLVCRYCGEAGCGGSCGLGPVSETEPWSVIQKRRQARRMGIKDVCMFCARPIAWVEVKGRKWPYEVNSGGGMQKRHVCKGGAG